MKMNLEEFKEKLLVYGAEVSKWPRGERESGLSALENSDEFQALRADVERFEQVLKARKYEEPCSDLARRIVSASQPRKMLWRTVSRFFHEFLPGFGLPKPVFTAFCVSLAFLLVVGFAIGFSGSIGAVSVEQDETTLEGFLNYEGDVL